MPPLSAILVTPKRPHIAYRVYFPMRYFALSILTGFPLTWKTWKTPGKLLEFYVRPGIFGMISRFTHIKAKYSAYIFTTYFLQQVLTLIAFNYVWQPFGNYCGPIVFDIRLRTMTESTWKILILDWKTPGKLLEFFSSKRVGTLVLWSTED